MDAFAAADVYTDKEWDHVMGVNLNVPTRMIRAVLPVMRAKKAGAIINIASRASVSGAASGLAYTASKHALVSLTVFFGEKKIAIIELNSDHDG